MSTEVRLFRNSTTGRLLAVRPHLGEEPSTWLARHLRFCGGGKMWSIVFNDEADIERRFVPLEHLGKDYRKLLETK